MTRSAARKVANPLNDIVDGRASTVTIPPSPIRSRVKNAAKRRNASSLLDGEHEKGEEEAKERRKETSLSASDKDIIDDDDDNNNDNDDQDGNEESSLIPFSEGACLVIDDCLTNPLTQRPETGYSNAKGKRGRGVENQDLYEAALSLIAQFSTELSHHMKVSEII